MSSPTQKNTPTNIETWWSINKLVVTVILTWLISNIIAVGVAMPMFDFSEKTMVEFIANPIIYPQYKMAMLQIQGIISVFTFVAAPMFYLKYVDNVANPIVLSRIEPISVKPLLWILTPLIVIGFMPVDSWIVEWNQSIALPEAFKGIEQWAKETENQLQALTKYLTSFDNIIEFLAALVILSVVPAIGEELLFRGVLQNKIQQLTKNYHVAIWIAAFVFSAIHFQFYGFVPRLLLGALFGYLYVWSGNLAIPMLAHFVNNGFTLLLLYAGVNLDTTVPIEFAALSFVLVSTFVYFFKKIATENTQQPTL